jgi:hypothetical protein
VKVLVGEECQCEIEVGGLFMYWVHSDPLICSQKEFPTLGAYRFPSNYHNCHLQAASYAVTARPIKRILGTCLSNLKLVYAIRVRNTMLQMAQATPSEVIPTLTLRSVSTKSLDFKAAVLKVLIHLHDVERLI